jgi:flagellar protein FlbD
MIEVTRLNGNPMIVNSDLIKIAEASPDTMLTLIHGEKLIVRESCAEIVEKVLAYRASLLAVVAERMKSAEDLPRLVSLASLSVDSVGGGASAGATLSGGKTATLAPAPVTEIRSISASNAETSDW